MTGAAVAVVAGWCEHTFDRQDLAGAWPLTDEPLRLALVQSWLVLEQDRADVAGKDLDALADVLASAEPDDPLWPEFAYWRLSRWRAVLPDYVTDAAVRGFVSLGAPLGVDLEAVMLSRSDDSSDGTFDAGEPLPVYRVLVRHTEAGARVAGLGGVLPVPGWPPSETDRLPH